MENIEDNPPRENGKVQNEKDNEQDLFRSAVGPIRRIHSDRVELRTAKPAPIPHSRQQDIAEIREEMLNGAIDPSELDTGEELYYCRPGLQRSVLRRLRRGQYRVHAVLDLHGMNVQAAYQALNAFLYEAKREHFSCVRIIHGKGKRSRHNKGPVLKVKVNHWLRQRDDILAFSSARPIDGGTGAVYVLVRS